MRQKRTGIIPTDRGCLAYWTLDELTRREEKKEKKKLDPDQWGICGCADVFWIGEQVVIEGKEALRLPIFDILERKKKMHPDWGDEELYVFAGLHPRTNNFVWFLLNEEEALDCIAREDASREAAAHPN